ncbi:DUF1748-domain-containing protein [Wolfiporia cocos MD-104 SS10]|uniref:DUF1748-domain-containing protein n=1 Tax=Wolfiporia cocos (strain MD-104) TaxID=742152 RepID=A0A2H3JWK2_WOLCO|nr:DUF1748-domain-containing protein [Wolfiporia cocos MD-104 SS10]
MVLGRLFHYVVDAVLVSAVVAGVRRSSGFTPATDQISDDTLRAATDKYLGIGETIFNMIQASVVNSEYFKRDSRR